MKQIMKKRGRSSRQQAENDEAWTAPQRNHRTTDLVEAAEDLVDVIDEILGDEITPGPEER